MVRIIDCHLRELLKARNMTQKELAAASGLTEDIISRIASGERVGTVATALAIMTALQCDLSDIWQWEVAFDEGLQNTGNFENG